MEQGKDHLAALLILLPKVLCSYFRCGREHVCQMPVLTHAWGCNYRCMNMNIGLRPLMQLQYLCVACSCKVVENNTAPLKSDVCCSVLLYWSKACLNLLIAVLHIISFVTKLGSKLKRSMEGLIRWESKSVYQVMFDWLITGSSTENLRGLRWLTGQLKRLWRELGLHPGVRQPFPSRGLLKSSIMRNFILLLNVGYVLRWKPQQWSEFGQIGPRTERAQSLLSSTIIVFHWFGRKRVTGHV